MTRTRTTMTTEMSVNHQWMAWNPTTNAMTMTYLFLALRLPVTRVAGNAVTPC